MWFSCARAEEGFLRLLEGCSYVIQGGGHTLMSEALHLGKPILTLPLKAMVEQRFNALYVERLNYGMRADMLSLEPELLRRFEARLPEFQGRPIAAGNFCGNRAGFRPGGPLHPPRQSAAAGRSGRTGGIEQ